MEHIQITVYRETYVIEKFKFAGGDFAGAERPDLDDSDGQTFRGMDYWGGYDVMAWFRAVVPIPKHLHDQQIELRHHTLRNQDIQSLVLKFSRFWPVKRMGPDRQP